MTINKNVEHLWERDFSDVEKIIKNKIILKFEIFLCNLYSQIRYKKDSNIKHRVQLNKNLINEKVSVQ